MKGPPKNGGEGCHSEPGAADGFQRGGRGEAKPGAAPALQGTRMSGPLLRGLAVVGPQPTAPGATERRPGAVTISSSSAASADEPSTPLGLGVRWLGDVEPEPEAEGSPAGRAMGAIGAMGAMGATGRPMGPRSAAIDGRRAPGASCVGDASGFCTGF